jgi:hypothetical protein
MVNPVPGRSVSTAYRKSGVHWKACAWHTGQDYAAPKGTKVVAARAGTVKHVNYGAAFGSKQVAVLCPDGTEDFYAHMCDRVANGTKVTANQKIGAVGSEGNSTGPHLHFERHKVAGKWNCSNMDDPMKSHNSGVSAPSSPVGAGKVYVSKLIDRQKNSDSVIRLQAALNRIPLVGGVNLPTTGNYLDKTKAEVSKWQKQKATDKTVANGSKVTPKQADQLFAGTANTVVDDISVPPLAPPPTPPPSTPPPGGTMPKFIYSYTGKPAKNQDIKTAYTAITNGRFVGPGDGWVLTMCYVNNGFGTSKTGGFRCRAVREAPVDETCYHDYAVTKDMVAPGSFLLQPIWFGAIKKGRPMRWDLRRSKSLGDVAATTRYTKWLWVSADILSPSVSDATRGLPSVSGEDLRSQFLALISRMYMDEGNEPVEIVIS